MHIPFLPIQAIRSSRLVCWVIRAIERGQPYPSDAVLASRFRAQQLSMLSKLGMATVPTQLVGGLMVVQTVREQNPIFCAIWSGLLLALSAIAMVRLRRNLRIKQATRLNVRVGTALIMCVASLWGSLPLVALPLEGEPAHLAVLLAIACMASAGAVVFQKLPIAATGWVLILSASTMVAMWRNDLTYAAEMCLVALMYSWVMIRNVWMSSRLFFARLYMSERKRKQAKITARNAQIGQSISNCILLLDRSGRVTWVNTGFTRCFGHTLADVVHQLPGDWLHPDDGQQVAQALWRSLVTRRHARAELRCKDKDGAWLWMHVDIKRQDGADRCAREYIVVAHDVTELKHTAEALLAEKERQRRIIDGTHCGTWEIDFDLGVCKIGGHWLDIIGVDTSSSAQDVEGWHVMRRMHPDDQPGHQEAVLRYIRGETTQYAHEHRLRHEDGSWHWVSARGKASAYDAQGQITQLSGTVMDISKSKVTELALIEATRQAKQGSQAKSLFLATMSHEIRTPMNGVIGTAEWLKATRLDEEQRDGINTIVDSGRSLLTIIDDILDFTKVEAGRMKLEESPLSLVELAEGVADAITPVAITKHVDLHLYIDPHLPSRIMGDPNRLRQVLFNLVGNAVKFGSGTPDKRGQVDVHILAKEGDATSWQMLVSDDGIGMTPETLRKVFTPFTQAEASTTRRFGGTGLGLAICNRLVDLMGGGITAGSIPGHGSTFTVTLPMLTPADAEPPGPPDRELDGVDCIVLPGQNYRRDTFAAYLEHAGATIHWCDEPQEVTALAAELNPAVVLLDAPEHTHGDQHSEADRSSLGWGDHIRQLWVGRYQHGPVRILSPRVGHLGRAHVQDVIRGVAVLAGRRSPDLVRNELKDFEALSAEIGSAEHQQSANSYLILIAEDDSTNQKVVKRQLQILGYTCEIADDGLAALAQWRTGRFDLLLSDLHMPEMDGYELAQQIRAEEAAHHFNRVPILALTANALAGEQARAQACGMDDYLTKPIELKALHHALKRWLPVASNLAQDFERGEALPETPPPANAHINVDTLRQLVGDDDDIVHELLLDFVTSSRALGESFALAASTHAMEQVKQIAHKLKSAARSVGAHALGQICESMESSADTGDDSSKLIGELLQELKQVHLAIDNLIQEPVQ